MRRFNSRAGRLAVPLRYLLHRFTLLILFSIAVALLVLGKSGNPTAARVRAAVVDVFAPVIDVLSRPIDLVYTVVDEGRNLIFLHRENRRLREENARLLRWQETAHRLASENRRFRELLDVRVETATPIATARVIGDSGGSFVRALLLNAGARDGIRTGQAVVNAFGLVGHVVAVGRNAARALLPTDLNSRIPVAIGTDGRHAIMAGDNSALPRLEYLDVGVAVRAGDRVVTSGDGGILPPGIPVGQVVEDEGRLRVRLFAALDQLDFVRVLAYQPPTVTRTVGPLPLPLPASPPAETGQ